MEAMMKKYKVKLTTKQISLEWWGQQWCANVSNYADYSNRLERGRAYIRKGAVGEIEIHDGIISTDVKGTRPDPYHVEIKIDPVSEDVAQKAMLQIKEIDALANGFVPNSYRDLFSVEHGLFPNAAQIHFSCSCPDVAYTCKHVASVLYAIGSILDYEPLLLFELRGIDVQKYLNAKLHSITNQLLVDINSFESEERLISDDIISELFGIDVMTDYTAESEPNNSDKEAVIVIEIGTKKKKVLPERKHKEHIKRNPIEGHVLRQYSLTGQLIEEYTSYEEASGKTAIGMMNIQRACKGYKKSAGGFFFFIVPCGSVKHNIAPLVSEISDGLPRPIICYKEAGILVARYDSVAEACRRTGINSKSIRDAARGVQKHAGGYVWQYE